jgi:hypothetical protein
MKKPKNKIEISLRAFEARMKRYLLSHDGLLLKVRRENSRDFNTLGRYYTVTLQNNVSDQGLSAGNLIQWAEESGVLKPYEIVGE